MAFFRIDPSPKTTVNVFSPAHDPLLAIDPGDTITAGSSSRRAC